LRNVRRAAEHDETMKEALSLAAGSLGSRGPDLLYEVWQDDPDAEAGKQAKLLLDSEAVKVKLEPALRIALDLRATKTCKLVLQLLPRAVRYADTRSVPVLEKLRSTRGCGLVSLGDCYPCLRGDDTLKQAFEAAESRQAPKF
jgi:hypothetical protein